MGVLGICGSDVIMARKPWQCRKLLVYKANNDDAADFRNYLIPTNKTK